MDAGSRWRRYEKKIRYRLWADNGFWCFSVYLCCHYQPSFPVAENNISRYEDNNEANKVVNGKRDHYRIQLILSKANLSAVQMVCQYVLFDTEEISSQAPPDGYQARPTLRGAGSRR